MAGLASTKKDIQERVEQCLVWLRDCTPRTVILQRCREKWGVSRASAYRYLRLADESLVETMDKVDRKAMLSNLLEQFTQVAIRANEQGNYGASVAALNSIAKLTKLTN